MGRVIKAAELWAPPLRLADRRQRELLRLLTARADDAALNERSRDRITALALEMARRIVGRAVELDAALLDNIYRRALDRLGDLPPATLRVHPADRSRSTVDRLAAEAGCVIAEDPTVGSGGCLVEGPGATVDASIDAVIAALRQALEGRQDG